LTCFTLLLHTKYRFTRKEIYHGKKYVEDVLNKQGAKDGGSRKRWN